MTLITPTKPIKEWAEDDRPREKLASKGKEALSNAELLAILIGSGNRHETAVDLARRILDSCQNNLLELSKLGLTRLRQFRGVGLAKAITIEAALELARRRPQSESPERRFLKTSKDAYEILRFRLEDLREEQCWVLFLNRANGELCTERISSGGLTGTVVDVRVIFRRALELGATGIILSHNHPSGNLQPSQADDEITRKARMAGDSLDIRVLDHLIISDRGYYSYADEGRM